MKKAIVLLFLTLILISCSFASEEEFKGVWANLLNYEDDSELEEYLAIEGVGKELLILWFDMDGKYPPIKGKGEYIKKENEEAVRFIDVDEEIYMLRFYGSELVLETGFDDPESLSLGFVKVSETDLF